MKKRSHIFRGLASIFLALMVLFGTVMSVALSWEGRVNELLGVSDDTFARSQNPDDYYYKSDYEDPADLIKAEIALNTRMEAEGAVALKGTPAVDGTGVTLFGMRSQAMQYGGSMGSLVETKQAVRLADALEEYGFSVNPAMVSFYEDMEKTYAPTKAAGGNCVDTNEGSTVNEVPVKEYFAVSPDSMEGYKDAAIVVLGRDAGDVPAFTREQTESQIRKSFPTARQETS